MPIETKATCDRCGATLAYEKTPGRQMIAVGIALGINKTMIDPYSSKPQLEKQALWCRECAIQTGVMVPITKEDKEIKPEQEKTFE